MNLVWIGSIISKSGDSDVYKVNSYLLGYGLIKIIYFKD